MSDSINAAPDREILTNPKIRVDDDEIVYTPLAGPDIFDKTVRCTYFIAVLFANGHGIHSIDGVNHSVGRQQLHFLFPGQHHHWEIDSSMQGRKITVGRKLFETFSSTEIFHLIRYNPHPVFRLEEPVFHEIGDELEAISEHILLNGQRHPNYQKILSIRMSLIALMISRQAEEYIKNTVLKSAHPIVRDFWLLVNTYFDRQKAVSWYASQLQISNSYLNRLCKEGLNITAKHLIEQKVLLEAKQRLRARDASIKEITFDLGFSGVANFSNFFRRKCGFSPKEYQV